MKFSEMKIDHNILKALTELKFIEPTEIQAKSIPVLMEGKDLIAQAMTGSGKTLAFGIPIVEKIEHGNGIQALVISPTRELADQIAQVVKKISQYKHAIVTTVFGGVDIQPQINNLRHSDIVVGTPGRILDHLERGTINLSRIRILVLDEADRMLDMGFIDDIRRIIQALPRERQTILFSATMPEEIENLARRFMKHPFKIKTQSFVSKEKMKQFYYDVREDDKLSLLVHLIKKERPSLALVFCATRGQTDFVARVLENNGVEAKPIHGGMSQNARMSVLEGFHRGKPHVLVATDVAARGLDIKNVSHIFNYSLPNDAENYTHRIGRTARIGMTGKVVSLLSKEDHEAFRRILRYHDVEKAVMDYDYPRIRVPPRHHSLGDRRPPIRRRPRRW